MALGPNLAQYLGYELKCHPPPQNLYIEALTLSVVALGYGAFENN